MHDPIESFIKEIISLLNKFEKAMDNNPKTPLLDSSAQPRSKELYSVISYVVSFLPMTIFLKENKQIKSVFEVMLAKELLLFLSQESIWDPEFKLHLSNFKDEMLDILMNKIYVPAGEQ